MRYHWSEDLRPYRGEEMKNREYLLQVCSRDIILFQSFKEKNTYKPTFDCLISAFRRNIYAARGKTRDSSLIS